MTTLHLCYNFALMLHENAIVLSQSDVHNIFLYIINPLTPRSRKRVNSPHNITAKLNIKVVRIKEIIAI